MKGFGTIIADPPWSFSDKGSRIAPDWKGRPRYAVMRPEDILALPVEATLAASSGHLYLWTTDSHLELALQVVRAWGYTYKKAIVWVKRRPGGPLQIGMGHYYRSAKELCLFATRGGAKARIHNIPDVFEAPRGEHSVKPDVIHEWAERLSPGPRIELFARRHRLGWQAWGDQLTGRMQKGTRQGA
jgi:N6-adenosine-specific RNA methylase IME4